MPVSRPLLLLLTTFSLLLAALSGHCQTFRVRIAPALHQEALDGRLLLLSDNNKSEPRFQINDAAGQRLFDSGEGPF